MKPNTPKTILWLLALLVAVSGCQQEDTLPQEEEQSVMGRIVLNMTDIDVYVDAQTRSTQTLNNFDGFVFTLTGTAVESGTVTDKQITFVNRSAVIEAGTYTLTASNQAASQTGNGCPHYEGTSSEFTLSVGGTTTVSIGSEKDPLTPQNSRLQLTIDGSFSNLYNTPTVTLDPAGRNLSFTTASPVYFPAGSVSYSITAAAKSGKHVTDISGASGTITVSAGMAHTITLTASPVTGEIIPLIGGDPYTGVFD